MDKLENDVLKFIRENDLIKKGEPVAVGFSGGADSLFLLTVLYNLRKLLKIKLMAVHVNHSLRGSEAKRDALFCRKYADELGILFDLKIVDTPGFVIKTGMSEEEAARFLRYQAINQAASKAFHTDYKIALAHQANDQAETVLFNLVRGSGLKGLGGMRAKRDNIIRPLLNTTRNDILNWLKKRNLNFVTDSTNLENLHSRNFIRNIILPMLEEKINSEASFHIGEFGNYSREADEFLTGEAKNFLKIEGCGVQKSKDGSIQIKLSAKTLKLKARVLRLYVIIEGLNAIGAPLKDWSRRHFEAIDGLLFLGKGAVIDLPGSFEAKNIYHETLLINKDGGYNGVQD